MKAALAGRYDIVGELGRGATATVYLAQDLKHNRSVAIKVLHREIASLVAAERFLREIEITAGLTHPHILPLLDSGEADGCLYYVMPYAEGESLRQRLEREGQLPIDEALRIADQVADALSYAHERGVVHRDVKPENILLEAGHAVVSDFGIARAVSVAGGQRLTDTGVAVGTPAYMSPEQASGEHELDARSDLYSLGCVLYEMLAGEPPFSGRTAQAVLTKHMMQPPQPIETLRPAVSPPAAEMVHKVLAKVPADRFSSTDEFRAALKSAAEGESIARLEGHPRLRRALGAIAALLVVVGISIWLASRGESPPQAFAEGKSVAVLPCENMSGDSESELFSDGITVDVITQLQKIADLRVISPKRMMEYRGTEKSLRQIGEELGVATVLECGVRQIGDAVRVSTQLSDPASGEILWADSYDSELTDVFAVWSEVAIKSAMAVGAELAPRERVQIERQPTQNARAMDLFLRAYAYVTRPENLEVDFVNALRLYEEAVRLDPQFALAFARMSEVHSYYYHDGWDRSETRLKEALRSVTRALDLEPNLPEAHLALGKYHYMGFRDYDRALEEFAIAEQALPGDEEVIYWKATIKKRQGEYAEARSLYEKAAQIGARQADCILQIGISYHHERRYAEAEAYYDSAIALEPEFYRVPIYRHSVAVWGRGQTGSMRSYLESLPTGMDPEGRISFWRWYVEFLDGDSRAALDVLAASDHKDFAVQIWYYPHTLLTGLTHWAAGDTAPARVAFDAAREELEAVIVEQPDDDRLYRALGQAYAGLGRREDAVWAAHRALEVGPLSSDAVVASMAMPDLPWIYSMAGEHEAALDHVERYLSGPGLYSIYGFAADPRLRAVHDHPRFQAMLERYGQ